MGRLSASGTVPAGSPYFSLPCGVSALIIQVKTGRLRVHILVKVMLWFVAVPGFEPGSVGTVHWPLLTRDYLGSAQSFSRPQIGHILVLLDPCP